MKNKLLIILLTFLLSFIISNLKVNIYNFETINTFSKSNIIYFGDRNEKKIYLTFDDGYPYKNTYKIVSILKEKNIPATLFLEGDFLTHHASLINDAIDNNILIGCHTMDHKDITQKSDYTFLCQLKEYEEKFYSITGIEMPRFFRPPMGKINRSKLNILEERNYIVFLWDVAYYDYNIYYEKGKQYAYDYVTTNTQNGSIILLHTLTKSNVEALPSIIDELKRQGFIFSSLNDFFF